jgi:hypothetical protein
MASFITSQLLQISADEYLCYPWLRPERQTRGKKRKLGKGRLNSVGFFTSTFHARAVALNEVILCRGLAQENRVCSLLPRTLFEPCTFMGP